MKSLPHFSYRKFINISIGYICTCCYWFQIFAHIFLPHNGKPVNIIMAWPKRTKKNPFQQHGKWAYMHCTVCYVSIAFSIIKSKIYYLFWEHMSFVNVISSITVNHLQNVQTLTSYLQYSVQWIITFRLNTLTNQLRSKC